MLPSQSTPYGAASSPIGGAKGHVGSGTPKDLLGYFAGLTDLPFPVFCVICTLGRIPSVVTSTLGGNALGTESYAAAVIVFAIALAVSALGLAAYHWICRKYKAVRQAG